MRLNFHNRMLRVAANDNPPFVTLKFIEQTQSWRLVGGIEMKLIETLGEYFNFTYVITNCFNTWGTKLPNNTWIGSIGMLSREEADLAIGATILNYDRSQAVPYLYPHYINEVTFITRAPHLQPNLYLVLKPFDHVVWMAFLISLLLCLLFDYFYCYMKCRTDDKVFWISIYSLFRQQYHSRMASGTALALWFNHWRLGTFVLTTAYAGCLCSLITVPSRAKPINTIEELYLAGISHQITIAGIANSGYIHAIKNSNTTLHREIGKILKLVKDKKEGMEIVRDSVQPHAFITGRESLRHGQLIMGINLIHLPPDEKDANFFYEITGLPFSPKFYKFAPHFNWVISRLISAGLINYWKEQEFDLIDRNPKTKKSIFSNYTLEQVQSFFYVYFLGIIMAMFFLMVEIIWLRAHCR